MGTAATGALPDLHIDHPLITDWQHGQSLRAPWHAAQNSPERMHEMKRYKSGAPLRQSLSFAVLAPAFILAAVIGGSSVGGVATHPSSGTVNHHDRAEDLQWNGTGSEYHRPLS
ncbi:hypothetical protein [Streptomyces sp. AB3(2024)]|uniref:hypothetical protein n=1 Tax=Streptomyces sp. AB3(2024) TaxID=3317321 RepID=UPI0035A2BE1A